MSLMAPVVDSSFALDSKLPVSTKFEELKLAFEVPTKSHFVAVNNQVSVVSRHYVTTCETW